ncbi:MAG: dockerin type I domain-containing protein [Candidatus Rokubacteria bacterium]|nr:dockerin type I domain-containing protein [Candidatus Rokubacteria bacterium]
MTPEALAELLTHPGRALVVASRLESPELLRRLAQGGPFDGVLLEGSVVSSREIRTATGLLRGEGTRWKSYAIATANHRGDALVLRVVGDKDIAAGPYDGAAFIVLRESQVLDTVEVVNGGADDEGLGTLPAPLEELDAVTLAIDGPPLGTGDLDGDGDVDGTDQALLAGQIGACAGNPAFEPAADLDGDGCVTAVDGEFLELNRETVADLDSPDHPARAGEEAGSSPPGRL